MEVSFMGAPRSSEKLTPERVRAAADTRASAPPPGGGRASSTGWGPHPARDPGAEPPSQLPVVLELRGHGPDDQVVGHRADRLAQPPVGRSPPAPGYQPVHDPGD